MRFNLIKKPIIFNYSNSNLELVSNFKDLGIIFDSKLNFTYYTKFIKNKAMRIHSFIKRSCKDFCDSIALKILYCSLVRSNLDYYLLIWINNTSKQNDNIEHGSYDNILNCLSLIPLKTRRLHLIPKFLHKLIYRLIDCPDLLYLINFKINSFNTRNPELFCPINSDKNYLLNSNENQLMIAGNNYSFNFD
jgi:hypothetical protein